MIYLDSSALVKLLIDERGALHSASAWPRGREAPRQQRAARALLRTLDLVPMARGVLNEAAETGGVALGTLDAIHLASALSIADGLTWFVGYDRRLAAAASDAGLQCTAPGV